MNKQLVIFLLGIIVLVGGLVFWHLNRTDNPYDAEAFFGQLQKAEPALYLS